MLIDTHCHLNTIVKKTFDVPLDDAEYILIEPILTQAAENGVTALLNVGTSLVESINCIEIAQRFSSVWASVGIHPNDLTEDWQSDLHKIKEFLSRKEELKIQAIGECGMDKHYPGYSIERQRDGFRSQIELALEHDLALVIHTRDAGDDTLRCLEEYQHHGLRGTIHCFSEDHAFAQQAISWGFVLGIGGTITYPKNEHLRTTVKQVGIDHLVLETDAPFLPPQVIRGQQNSPAQIRTIALYLADLLEASFEDISRTTTENVKRIFRFP